MNHCDPMQASAFFPDTGWTVSSRCGPNGGNCVAVNHHVAHGIVGVRDTKMPASPVLVFSGKQWRNFLTTASAGAYDG